MNAAMVAMVAKMKWLLSCVRIALIGQRIALIGPRSQGNVQESQGKSRNTCPQRSRKSQGKVKESQGIPVPRGPGKVKEKSRKVKEFMAPLIGPPSQHSCPDASPPASGSGRTPWPVLSGCRSHSSTHVDVWAWLACAWVLLVRAMTSWH